MPTYCYSAFGLAIESEIAINVLPETTEAASVTVRLGATPQELIDRSDEGICFQVSDRNYLFWVDAVARFHVRNGCEITVELAADADPADTWCFLLGNAIGAILLQRGHLVLHASAVLLGDRAVALAGASGAGKSTTAAALCSRGGRLICDDLCAISGADRRVLCGTSVLKLWPDSVNALGIETAHGRAVRLGLSKRFLPLPGPVSARSHPLAAIYLLEPQVIPATRLRATTGRHRFGALESQIYRPRLTRAVMGPHRLFSALSNLATSVAVTVVQRPTHGFNLDDLCQTLLSDVRIPSPAM